MENDALKAAFLQPFTSKDHCRDWIETYLDLRLPDSFIDPASNSSPIDAIYETYCNYRDDKAFEIPGYIWLSARECYKTLAESVLVTILMVHFGGQIAHLAAIKSQSKKAIQYVNAFLRKLSPYLEHHNMRVVADSESRAQVNLPTGEPAFVNVIICTVAGANSEHVPFMTFDELDTVRFPQAYAEAKLIPGRLKGRGPLTVKCSTRKFAFGIMQAELDMAAKTREKILRWNILDVTEKCPASRHQPELPQVERFVAKELPLTNMSPAEYEALQPSDKPKYDRVKAYAGCAGCPLLQVCRTRLAHRPEADVGGLYKPINLTIRQFQITEPDMAEAQLLCNKPSLSGLIYPRFEEDKNTITLAQAWMKLTGDQPPADLTLDTLIAFFHKKGINFYVGGDWGHVHNTAFVVSAILPSGEWWLFDTYAVPGLEWDDILKLAIQIRDKYRPKKWHMDTAQPMFIKTFNKNRMPCARFDKDVTGGISCVRKQIVDATGRRRLQVLRHDRNEHILEVFRKHHYKLDAQGEPTTEPDDDTWADAGDSLRYSGQNLFAKSMKSIVGIETANMMESLPKDTKAYESWIAQQARKLAQDSSEESKGSNSAKTIFWDFGSD